MNALMDEECVNLDNIPEFVAKYYKKEPNGISKLDVPEKPKNPVVQAREVRPLAVIQSELHATRRQYDLIKLEITTSDRLKDPQANKKALLETLKNLPSEDDGSGEQLSIERQIAHSIHAEWLDSASKTTIDTVKQYIEQYKWPKNDFAPLSQHSDNCDMALRQFFESALELNETAVFDCLAKPIGDRIVFHFKKSSDTAQRDKPEWLFTYLFKTLELRQDWLTSQLQLLVAEPLDKLLRALIPALVYACNTYEKSKEYMLQIIQCAQTLEREFWVSKETTDTLVYQLSGGTQSIARFILDQSNIYSLVLSNNIMGLKTETDFDADVFSAKPTFAALHVKQLLNDADYLLRLNPPLILKKCHLRILEEYRLHLVSTEEQVATTGTSSYFQILCELYGSAAYFKSVLDNWSTSLVVATEETSAIRNSIENYGILRDTISQKIVKSLLRTSQKALKPYFLINWLNESEERLIGLHQFENNLKQDIALISKLTASSRADWARIVGAFAEQLGELFFTQVVQGNVFTAYSADLLQSDIEHIWIQFNLPCTVNYHVLLDSINVLKTGKSHSEYLSKEEVRGLISRRKN